jgi:hypothetical protein
LIDTNQFKGISHRQISKWLLSVNALTEQTNTEGKTQKRPTEIGKQLGISVITRIGTHGEYRAVVYDKKAQAFIVENIEAVLALEG